MRLSRVLAGLFVVALGTCLPFYGSSAAALQRVLKASDVKGILSSGRASSVEGVLANLPADFMKQFSLVVETPSPQFASLQLPRVIVSGDPRLLMAFAGAQDQRGSNTIEMIEFNDQTKKFDFFEIVFNNGKYAYNINPPKCMGCHHRELRPNWSSYPFWERVLGSHHRGSAGNAETANFEPHEEAALKAWLQIAGGHPRYRHLNLSALGEVTLETLTDMNSKTTDQINRQNSVRIAAEVNGLLLKKPQFIPALYTILSEQELGDPTDAKLLSAALNQDSNALALQYLENEKAMLMNERAKGILQHANALGVTTEVPNPLHHIRNLDIFNTRTSSRIRLLLEHHMGHSIDHWTTRYQGKGFQNSGGTAHIVDLLRMQVLYSPTFKPLEQKLEGISPYTPAYAEALQNFAKEGFHQAACESHVTGILKKISNTFGRGN